MQNAGCDCNKLSRVIFPTPALLKKKKRIGTVIIRSNSTLYIYYKYITGFLFLVTTKVTIEMVVQIYFLTII